ncbi:hypothetical protein [Sinanaerobacter sp. ZZT-01]|uniref:hypothetical protein n=1 Tax=Sinanaerobacter sp. ZZT-01 TaxID=3111540 RepID=UPI002D772F81|nr:hypothetical protein [Sinanaerobacter sp. ZZT-01]WRR92676.1 hypothetical protein U5921_11565 [Sinanaerobacter sp. ZZT-01]
MTISDLILNVKALGFDSVIYQSDIKTEEDIKDYQGKGYNVSLTEEQFKNQFPIDPSCVAYSPSISNSSFYFNRNTLAALPLHLELLQLGMGDYKEQLPQVIESREQEVLNNDYLGSILSLTDSMKIEYFNMLIEKGTVEGLYTLFFSVYTSADFGFKGISPENFELIVSTKTKSDMKKTENQLKDLPETLTIYRGEGSQSTPTNKAYSWTLDINMANFFACRLSMDEAQIITARVNKDKVVDCFIKDSNEKEVIVRPSDIEIVDMQTIKGIEDLDDIFPAVIDTYKDFRETMLTLNFAQDSSVHGKEHTARVLLLSLILSELLNLPQSDRKILSTAAIYHDTKRVNDNIDLEHGYYSSLYYQSNVTKPDPTVSFLIEYHCRPDDEGYEEIKRNRVLSKNRTKTQFLFNLFKDADALDRVRFGLQDLDVNQLRLPESKSLPLIARICLEQLKI